MRHVSRWETQGERIKRLAKDAEMNLTQLADKAKLNPQTVYGYGSDKRGLGPTNARKLAEALGVAVDELVVPKPEKVTLATLARRVAILEDVVVQFPPDSQDAELIERRRREGLDELARRTAHHLRLEHDGGSP